MENKVSFLCASRYICVHRQTGRHHTFSKRHKRQHSGYLWGEGKLGTSPKEDKSKFLYSLIFILFCFLSVDHPVKKLYKLKYY